MFNSRFLKLILGLSLAWSLPSILRADGVPSDPAKFDVYLLVGQSNMAGRGILAPNDKKADPRILVFDSKNEWVNRGEPVHFDKPVAGVGLGFAFAKCAADKRNGVMIGLIPCAVGGTPVKDWQPGAVLFQNAVQRTQLALKQGGILKGILWHQGEAECRSPELSSAYAHNLTQVIEGFRKAFNTPNVPFIAGELGEYLYTSKNAPPYARDVNAQIDSLPGLVPNTAVVSSKDLTSNADQLHFNSKSLKEFGKRYFDALQNLSVKKP